MTLYVRMADGTEDELRPTHGCEACGHPMKPNPIDPKQSKESRCPNCGACERYVVEKQYSNAGEVAAWAVLRFWSPEAQVDDHGNLTVKRGPAVMAYYPQGAWMSYRSD